MADFSDGVKEYIEAEGKIRNFFNAIFSIETVDCV